jgi:uncharacterized membrane protein YdjX (TVP38/TMEM64 family)
MHLIPILLHWMQQIQSAGWLGWLMFIALYAVCCLFFIPASVLTFAAGAEWGFWGGTALVLAGNGLGSLLCLLLARYLFHDAASRLLKRHKKWNAAVDAVQHDGWKIVFWTRLSPVMPFSLINYSLGLTKISAWRFLLATELGSVPAIAAYVYFGTLAGNLAKIRSDVAHHGAFYWTMQGLGLVLAVGVTVYVTFLARKAMKGRVKKQAPA